MKREEISRLLDARVQLFFVRTHEEVRFEEMMRELAKEKKMDFFSWSLWLTLMNDTAKLENKDIYQAAEEFIKLPNSSVIVLKDCSTLLKDPGIKRRIKDFVVNLCYFYKADNLKYKPIFIIDAGLEIPTELEKYGTFIDFDLMKREEIMNYFVEQGINVEKKKLNKIVDNLRGLTQPEIENIVYYLQTYIDKKEKTDLVTIAKQQKRQIIKKSQFLDFISNEECIDDVGGMDILKDWLLEKGNAFSEEAKKYGLEPPKGVLLTGIPGSGKSLIAKSIAKMWEIPLIKLDVGRLFNRFVGESERQTHEVLRLIEAVSPCVLWLDEIEKGMAGLQSSTHTDGGTTARVLGIFLSWMQEHKTGTFLVGTSNNIKQLPPELLRKGRFNEIFFVSCPTENERKEIFKIHIAKRGRKPENFDLDKLARNSENLVGSEIEDSIISGMYGAFINREGDKKPREVGTDDILKAVKETIPIAKLMEKELEDLYNWTKDGRAKLASSEEKTTFERKIGFSTREQLKQKTEISVKN